MDVINSFPAIGPYMGVTMDKKITFKTRAGTRNFRIICYGAYNAFGLIGPEKNGLAILDEDERAVLADELARENSGYFGPSKNQMERFNEIRSMNWRDFRATVNGSKRNRYEI